MKNSHDRAPLNWSRNPSLFSFRARGSAMATLGAMTCLFNDVPPWLSGVFIAAGVLFLIGPNDRWRAAPWLTFLSMLAALTTLGVSVSFGIVRPALQQSAEPVGWALAFLAAAISGLASDEWMASAQSLRRQRASRRRVILSFFGRAPTRVGGRT